MISKFLTLSLLLVALVFGWMTFHDRVMTKPVSIAPEVINKQATSTTITPKISPTSETIAQDVRLSFDQIFSEDHGWINNLAQDKIRTLIATGDVLTARSVNYKTVTTNDFTRPFLETAEVLKKADLTLINLETPLIPNCPLTNEGMIFCGDTRNVEGLTFAGIDVASLANNHGGNHGAEGVAATVKALTDAGISPIGTSNGGPIYKDVKGLTFAFLGYNDVGKQPGVASADGNRIVSEIKEAKSKADIVIVMFHWGAEYTTQPTQRQRQLGHLAIDSGADVVVSNHPHWIQPIENYKGRIIAYALGNFVFDQIWSQKTQEGVVARFTFYEDKLVDLEFLPVSISRSGQPSFMIGAEKSRILNEMKLESGKLQSNQ